MANKKDKNRFYFNKDFLGSPEGRSVRILSEYYGPLKNIKKNKINDTIVFFGSARIKSEEEAKKILSNQNMEGNIVPLTNKNDNIPFRTFKISKKLLLNKTFVNLDDGLNRTLNYYQKEIKKYI